MVRDCYVAPPGYLFLESDLASIEVCTMAHLSNDPDLIGLLNSGVKFHRETAMRLFNTSREEVTETQYQVGKTTIFGTFLGQTGVGLMEQLWMFGLTQYGEDECQAFIDGVKHEVYPAIGKYEEKVARELRGTPSHPNLCGSIKDMWGMERRLPGIHSEDKSTVREAVSQGMSLRISGGAQGLIQNAISWLKDEVWRMQQMGVDVRWLLTIHDSLLMLVPEWAAEMVRAVVEEGLTRHCGVELKVQVRAESKMAKTWGAL
jgi:DNA polymerase-1